MNESERSEHVEVDLVRVSSGCVQRTGGSKEVQCPFLSRETDEGLGLESVSGNRGVCTSVSKIFGACEAKSNLYNYHE